MADDDVAYLNIGQREDSDNHLMRTLEEYGFDAKVAFEMLKRSESFMVEHRSWESDNGRKSQKMKALKYIAVVG